MADIGGINACLTSVPSWAAKAAGTAMEQMVNPILTPDMVSYLSVVFGSVRLKCMLGWR